MILEGENSPSLRSLDKKDKKSVDKLYHPTNPSPRCDNSHTSVVVVNDGQTPLTYLQINDLVLG